MAMLLLCAYPSNDWLGQSTQDDKIKKPPPIQIGNVGIQISVPWLDRERSNYSVTGALYKHRHTLCNFELRQTAILVRHPVRKMETGRIFSRNAKKKIIIM